MPEIYYDGQDKKLYIVAEGGAVRVLTALSPAYGMVTEAPPQPVRETKQRKWHKASTKGKALQDEIEGFHKKRQHPETAKIEQLLIEGKSVAEVLEEVQVSSPTVYIIKTRLKNEGRLTR